MEKKNTLKNNDPYNDESRKITAIRLKELRQNLKDEKGRSCSHETLAKKINEKYGTGSISDKTLLNYEITDEDHDKYTVGFGMKIQNLALLADFYNVSCDYLLGREGNQDELIGQARMEMGLSAKSAEVLFQLKAKGSRFAGRPDVMDTINRMLETINIMIETAGYTEHVMDTNASGESIIRATGTRYEDGLINRINDYLRFTCEAQEIDTTNILDGKTLLNRYMLDEDVLSKLLLLEINEDLISLRNEIQTKSSNFKGDDTHV